MSAKGGYGESRLEAAMEIGKAEHKDIQARFLEKADDTGASVAAERTVGDRRLDLVNDDLKLAIEIKPEHIDEPPHSVAEKYKEQLEDQEKLTGYEVQALTYSMDTSSAEVSIYRPGDESFVVESREAAAEILGAGGSEDADVEEQLEAEGSDAIADALNDDETAAESAEEVD